MGQDQSHPGMSGSLEAEPAAGICVHVKEGAREAGYRIGKAEQGVGLGKLNLGLSPMG